MSTRKVKFIIDNCMRKRITMVTRFVYAETSGDYELSIVALKDS